MKLKFKIYFTLIFISTKLYSQQVTCNMYTFENGIKKNSMSQPYTGPCITNYPNGKISQTGAFKNGLQDGKWEFYTENGKIEKRESYNNGKKDGLFEEYVLDEKGNFTILSRKNYKEDKPNGTWELFHNGILYDFQSYKDGEKNGVFREYSMEGKLTELRNLKSVNGKTIKDGIQVYYNKSGKHDTTTFKDDIKDGLLVVYHPNGQLRYRENWINGSLADGIYEHYDQDGSVNSREEYKDGVRNGIYEQYYQGKVWMKGTLKNDKKEGRWEEYEEGKLSKKASGYYENGKKIKNLN
jgi:antitoxin component YwqK of YwqJK toxin-antitoxin module